MAKPVILSYGLGVDSTAILLRWLLEPASRDFDLSDLIVITAMTGDEWPETGAMVTDAILPLMRSYDVRYVQVARKTGSQTDGITILDDSCFPTKLHLDGDYKLSTEMLLAGTVPQVGGVRKCSQKAKGWPLDTVIEQLIGKVAFRHVIGFESGEVNRAVKDTAATVTKQPHREPSYPLIDWGWDRATCEQYIKDATGIDWWKSACVYCPFALANKAGRERVLRQYRLNNQAAVDALFVEYTSIALNPKQGLNGDTYLLDLIRHDGNLAALQGLRERLDSEPHAVYQVRRIINPTLADPTKVANFDRSVRRISDVTDRAGAIKALLAHGSVDSDSWFWRIPITDRREQLPAIENMLVVAPAVVGDKKEKPGFPDKWIEVSQQISGRRIA